MSKLISMGLRYDGDAGTLAILDQSRLPGTAVWLDGAEPAAMVDHIVALRVRGAPMIGVCAALSLACMETRGASTSTLREAGAALRRARPTAVNLASAVDRVLGVLATGPLRAEAEAVFREDVALCAAMADAGAPLLPEGARVLTHCNTGGLATAGVGTALGVIRRAHEAGRVRQVWVDETRPLLQGGRLTAWELGTLGIPYAIVADAAAGLLMARGLVDAVVLGADRIAANGDAANKIGTYGLAVLARHHGVPFYVVAPTSTVDPATPDGAAIPIEERDPAELRGGVGTAAWAPEGAPAFNPAFDVTPAALISAWVLDTGVVRAAQVAAGAFSAAPPGGDGSALEGSGPLPGRTGR